MIEENRLTIHADGAYKQENETYNTYEGEEDRRKRDLLYILKEIKKRRTRLIIHTEGEDDRRKKTYHTC